MLNQITQLRLPDGQVVALVDWTDKPLYAAADLGNGFTNEVIDLFQTGIGRPVPAAPTPGLAGSTTPRTNSLADTNIATQGGMASTEEMLVYSIRPDVQFYSKQGNDFTTRASVGSGSDALAFMPAPNLAMLAVLNAQLLIELEISQKVYSQAGFGWFNSGFGPMAAAFNPDAGVLAAPATQGLPSNEAVRTLTIPQHIGGQEKYRVRLRNPGAGAVVFAKTIANPPISLETEGASYMATVRIYLDGLYKRPVS
jgi:hypothetical protein